MRAYTFRRRSSAQSARPAGTSQALRLFPARQHLVQHARVVGQRVPQLA